MQPTKRISPLGFKRWFPFKASPRRLLLRASAAIRERVALHSNRSQRRTTRFVTAVCCHMPLQSRTKRLQCCKRVSNKSSLTIIRTRRCRWQRADSRRRMRRTLARTTLSGDIHYNLPIHYSIFDNSRRLAAGESHSGQGESHSRHHAAGESHSGHHRALTRTCIRAPAVSRRSAAATPRVAQKPCSFSSDTRPSTATHRKRSARRASPSGYIYVYIYICIRTGVLPSGTAPVFSRQNRRTFQSLFNLRRGLRFGAKSHAAIRRLRIGHSCSPDFHLVTVIRTATRRACITQRRAGSAAGSTCGQFDCPRSGRYLGRGRSRPAGVGRISCRKRLFPRVHLMNLDQRTIRKFHTA